MQMGSMIGTMFNLRKLLPFSATASYSQKKLLDLIIKKEKILYKIYRKLKVYLEPNLPDIYLTPGSSYSRSLFLHLG